MVCLCLGVSGEPEFHATSAPRIGCSTASSRLITEQQHTRHKHKRKQTAACTQAVRLSCWFGAVAKAMFRIMIHFGSARKSSRRDRRRTRRRSRFRSSSRSTSRSSRSQEPLANAAVRRRRRLPSVRRRRRSTSTAPCGQGKVTHGHFGGSIVSAWWLVPRNSAGSTELFRLL